MANDLGFTDPAEELRFTRLVTAREELIEMTETIKETTAVTITGGRQMEIDEDLLWSATVMNVGRALKLDLDHTGQLSAAVLAATLMIESVGK
jgi:azurin